MRILIDIGHPAHVHYFRNLYFELVKKHEVTVTCKSVRIILQLLDHYKIPYINLGEKGGGIYDKIKRQLGFTSYLYQLIKDRQIELAVGVSASIVHATKFTKSRSILFDDDDQSVQPLTAKFVTPFADSILSPDSLAYERTIRAIYYPGFHELAYLHPKVFTPNPDITTKYGISSTDKYFVLRFNAFNAHHDINEGGMNIEQKRKLVRLLSGYGRVFITTEADLDEEFSQYRLPIAPEDIHHFLFFAQMLVSDSQTMTSEAAMLGTPSFRCNSFVGRISYLEEEEKRYDLTYGFLPHQYSWMLDKIEELLVLQNIKTYWQEKRQHMLRDKIDVSSFWLWFIENYPDSVSQYQAKKIDFNEFKQN